MRLKVPLQERKLDDLFTSFQSVEDEEIRAYLAKFLCIRASGLVESTFKNLVDEYASGTSSKPIQKFVSNKLKNVTNLKYDKLVSALKMLSNDWATEFEGRVSDEQKAALNSVISNRNNIAHGENDTISYELMKNYYQHIKEVVNHLKSIIKKN